MLKVCQLERRDLPAGGISALSVAAVRSATASVGSNMVESNGQRVTSEDGRYLLFGSGSPDLGTALFEGSTPYGLYRYDRATDTNILITRVAGTTNQLSTGLFSGGATISGDGRFVAFVSRGMDLIPNYVALANPNPLQLYRFDCVTGEMLLVSRQAGTASTGSNKDVSDRIIAINGHRIAYVSSGSNLIAGFTSASSNAFDNLFLFDATTGKNALVSHDAANLLKGGNGGSSGPVFSADGQTIAFSSNARNLVPGFTGESGNGFIYSVASNTCTLLTKALSGGPNQGAGQCTIWTISPDGRYAFVGSNAELVPGFVDNNGLLQSDLFRYDRVTGAVRLLSHEFGSTSKGANGNSYGIAMSEDCQAVIFSTTSTNLLPGITGGTAGKSQVFFYDIGADTYRLISAKAGQNNVASNGSSFDVRVSRNGRYVAYVSLASDLVEGYAPSGQFNQQNVYYFDVKMGETRLVNHRAGAPAASAFGSGPYGFSLASDGQFVLFASPAADIVPDDFNGHNDVFLWEAGTGLNATVARPSAPATVTASGDSTTPGVSRDGRYLVYASTASNAASGMTPIVGKSNIFLRDLRTGVTTLVSHTHDSLTAQAGDSTNPVISGDGRYIAYSSGSTQLVPGFVDSNGPMGWYNGTDVYLYDRLTGINVLVSRAVGTTNRGGNGVSGTFSENRQFRLAIDDAGRRVVFRSQAIDLVPNYVDGNGSDTYGLLFSDLFMFDRLTGRNVVVNHRFDSVTISSNYQAVAPIISGDGSSVVYSSYASDLVPGGLGGTNYQTILFDTGTGVTELVSHAATGPYVRGDGTSQDYAVSRDGRFVVHGHNAVNIVAGQVDTPETMDTFLYDRKTGGNTLLSHLYGEPKAAVGGLGVAGGVDISDDGRWIAFSTIASKVIPGVTSSAGDLVLYDRFTQTFTLASHAPSQPTVGADQFAYNPNLSGDGRILTFISKALNLAPGMIGLFPPGVDTTQAYSFDRLTGQVTLLTRSAWDPTRYANGALKSSVVVNESGSAIAFCSAATDLVLRDYNWFVDVFGYITPPPTITSMKVADGSGQRSVVRSLTVTFDQPVLFAGDPAAAFVVRRGSETVALSAAVTTGTATTVTLTFSGPGTQFGSLVDGRYSLTVLSSQVQGIEALDGDADGLAGGDYVANFHRLFGDSNGDAQVDSVDFLAFRLGLGQNNPAFDDDGDGLVGAADFLLFRLRFLQAV